MAGNDIPLATLAGWLAEADRVYAADGAADLCRAAGRPPDVVVGDLDSISDQARAEATDLRLRPDQDFTDADKVLAEIAADGWRSAEVCGLEGDLPDHELAALGSCLRGFADHELDLTLRYRRGRAWFAARKRPLEREIREGNRVSVMPVMSGAGLMLEGVLWPLKGARFGDCGKGSISNRTVGGPVRVSVESGAVWVFVGDEGS